MTYNYEHNLDEKLPKSAIISGSMLLVWIGLMLLAAIVAILILRFSDFSDATKITVLSADGEVIQQPSEKQKEQNEMNF